MLGSRASIRHCVWLLAACGWSASQADRAVEQEMRAQGVYHVQLLHRAAVDPELDMVVALGFPRGWPPAAGEGGWWSDKTKLGLFLQRRGEPGLLYKIAVESGRGDGDCYARVERATATDVVISCAPEKGRAGPTRKFVYDVRAKALVKAIAYDPFAMHRVFVSGEKAVLVGADRHRLAALEYQPGREPAFRLLTGAQAENWTRRVPFTEGTAGSGAELRHEIFVEPKAFKPAQFGPGNRFTLSRDEEAGSSEPEKKLVVLEPAGGSVMRFPLPQSTYEEFSLARPARVQDGYSREGTEMNEQIGPWQIADGKLWFGKTFYDGEGMTGVGGFGYFDAQAREYRTYSPKEIKDWSVSAMLVESDTVWLGLARRGEYGDSGGGMLRFDRATQKVNCLRLHEIVEEIARVGDLLVIATEFGAALWEGGKLRRFFVDQTTDGRLRVAEALPGAGDRRP